MLAVAPVGGRPAPLALVPELGLGRERDREPARNGPSSATSTGRSGGSSGLDFLDRLARAESQPPTPTSSH